MDFDIRRRLRHAQRRIFVEIALDGAAAIDGDFAGHELAQTVNDGALDLIEGVAGIDDLATNVTGDPDFVDLQLIAGSDADLGDFCEMPQMAVVERDAEPGAFPQGTRAPTGFFPYELENAAHALGVEGAARGRWSCVGRVQRRDVEEREAEIERVFAGGVREFINERLHDEGESVAAGSA